MNKKKYFTIAIILVASIVTLTILLYNPENVKVLPANSNSEGEVTVRKNDDDWKLILANKSNPLSKNFNVECEEISKGQFCDKRVTKYLNKMLADARSHNLPLIIASSYRSVERQETLYRINYNKFIDLGFTPEEAKKETERYQAPPGSSEHATGLAFDIVNSGWFKNHTELLDDFENTDEFRWLNENAYKYGFILRYQKEKTDITGYSYEPWHYRYVGHDVARFIKEKNITLEEYLSDYKNK